MDQFLTEAELAKHLGVSRWQLWSLRKQGLPHFRIGRAIRYRPDEVLAWFEEHDDGQQPAEPDDPESAQHGSEGQGA